MPMPPRSPSSKHRRRPGPPGHGADRTRSTSATAAPAHEIDGWRARIDALDATLLELLAQRTRLSVRVAQWKRASGVPLRTPAREARILARAKQAAAAPLTAAAAARIFRTILAEMRALQIRHAGGAGQR